MNPLHSSGRSNSSRLPLFDSIQRVSAVRILLDYRPALRQRTGVGEYVHDLASAVAASAPARRIAHALLVVVEGSAATPTPSPAPAPVDRRMPVRALNFAWHRLEWPPVERLTGATFDVVQSAHPLLIPSRQRRAGRHDSRSRFPRSSRAHARRDSARLPRARRVARAARRSRHRRVAGDRRARSRNGSACRDRRSSICSPGAPSWARRTRGARRTAAILFLGTLEPRKNLGVLLDAYERLLAQIPTAPPLVLAGRAVPGAEPILARAARAAARRPGRRFPGTSIRSAASRSTTRRSSS